ncbi:MAG: glycosyltransferase family 4 protein [Ignavibacteriae bacterium]|nr:glycosyltransferase family 4 protein [Ignavibacteria bacterium]MBI3363539.1 glycosyltransferase family 4 protein [Ignavibacteriota bacterium]
MKILIFNWQDIKNPLAGGAEVHLHEIFSRIAKMGHEVTLYCSSFPGALKEESINGIRVIREGGRYFFNFMVPLKYFARFRHERYDLVIDDMNKIPFFTALYVHEPLYIITHHLFGKSIFLEVPWPLALYVYVTEKMGFALCRMRKIPFIVGSPSTKQELLEMNFLSSKVDIINYCVDHEIHHPGDVSRSPGPLIGYFGRLKKYKAIEQLLQALAQVRSEVPDIRLVIVGEGDNRKMLEALARDLGIADAVRFTGFVDEREKVRLLQEVWFVVNTSSKEGWGLTVIEANACGTIVLASNVPGLRDAVRNGETGILYEFGNIEELTEKILLLLRNSSMRKSLARTAYAWAKTFDWEKAAQRTLELLQRRVTSTFTT